MVLFFGLLRPYKGLETLLEAWRGVEGAELWIVGRAADGRCPRTCQPPGVRFVPRFVSDPELAAFFRRADVVVLPYSRTARLDFSGVLATALTFGRAIVVSDVGGFGEVAAQGAARLVAPDDPGALRSALTELIEDPAERERLGSRARSPPREVPTRGTWPRARRWRYTGRSAPATAGCERLSTSALTSGATSVPNSSIDRSTSRCATAPTLIWPM